MHKENKAKSRAAAALALCFCVMAITSFLAVKSSINKITNNSTAVENGTSVSGQQQAAVQTPVVDSKDGESSKAENDESSAPAESPRYIVPVNGSIIQKYSMDSLVYSKTLDQYMTHPGIDIAAKLSTEVKAIADGTVSKVYNDDRYGITVHVTHDGGIVSVYSNLSEHGVAETGDDVSQNQTIGCIGDTALFESLDEAHLHFEIRKDGNCTDPGDFIEALKL